jgi:hypothetical protein
LALALVCLGTARSAEAAELALEWRAPSDCPDRDELAARVDRLLGGAVKSSFAAVTDVSRTGATYRAQLRTTSSAGFGERTLSSPRCEDLMDSVALVIALTAAPAANDTRRTGEEDGFGVVGAANANLVVGPLASPAFGFGGAIAAQGFSALRFELRGAYFLQQSTTFAGGAPGGDFDLVTFGARACRLWSFGVLDLAPCIGAEIYHVSAIGFGVVDRRRDRAAWWGPALGLVARVRLASAFAIYAAADGVMPVSRRPFVFPDIGELHRPSVVALQLLIAPEVHF